MGMGELLEWKTRLSRTRHIIKYMEGITEEDKIYKPIIIYRGKTIMNDIKTMEEMYYIAERFDEAVKKIKQMTQEEKEESIIKVNNWKGYTQRELEYLLYKLYE